MADRNVTFLILARDFASRTMDRVGNSTDRAADKLRDLNVLGLGPVATAGAALGPALLPALGGAVVATAGLGVAFAATGAAAGVFGAVVKTTFTEMTDAATKTSDLRDKIALLQQQQRAAAASGDLKAAGAYEKAAAKATSQYRAELALLPPDMRNAVGALGNLQTGWSNFVDAQKPVVLGLMTRGMAALTTVIPKLQPLFNAAASAATGLVGAFEEFVSSGMLDRLVSFLATRAGPAFESFGGILLSFGYGVGQLLAPFIATSDGVIGGIDRMSLAFAKWSRESGRAGVEKIIGYVQQNGAQVGSLLLGIGSSLATLAQAAAPLAPISLAIATGLTQLINAIPQPILTALIGGFIAWSVALRGAMIVTQISSVVGIFAGVMTGLTTAMTGGTLATGANTAAKVAYSVATGIATVATWAWDAALWAGATAMAILTSPIFLVVAALALFTAGIIYAWRHSETFRTVVTGAFDAVRGAIGWLAGAFTAAWSTIQSWYSNTIGFFQALPGRIMAGIAALPGLWVAYWRFILERGAFLIGYVIGTVIRVAMSLPGKFMAAVRALPGLWSAFWGNIGNRARSAASTTVNAVTSFFSQLPGRVRRAVSALWSNMSGAFSSAASNARSFASRAVTNAVAYFSQLPGRARRAISGLPGQIRAVFSGAGSWLVSAGGDIIRGLVRGIGNMVGAAVGEARRIASSIVGGVKAGLGIGSPSRVMADEVGRWIPPGIALGLTSAMPNLLGTVRSAVSSVTSAAQASGSAVWDMAASTGAYGSASLPAGVGGRTGDTIVLQVSGALDPLAVGQQLVQILQRWARNNGKTFELAM